MSEFVTTQRRGKVLEIKIDRPPANALSREMCFALYDAFVTLRDDPNLLVGILTAGGEKLFCAGIDLKQVSEEYSPDPSKNKPYTDIVEHMKSFWPENGKLGGFTEMWDLHKPVIAAVNGSACGGGFEMILRCDIIVSVDTAEFWFPELELGILPDCGGIQELPRSIPYKVAAELFWTGRRMSAQEAAGWGLIHKVVPRAQLMDTARQIAEKISRAAPLAIEALKECLPRLWNLELREAFDQVRAEAPTDKFPKVKRMLYSEDFMEGPSAFAEKRKPVWKGR